MDWCDGCMKMVDEDKLHKVSLFEDTWLLLCDNCYSGKGAKRGKSKPKKTRQGNRARRSGILRSVLVGGSSS